MRGGRVRGDRHLRVHRRRLRQETYNFPTFWAPLSGHVPTILRRRRAHSGPCGGGTHFAEGRGNGGGRAAQRKALETRFEVLERDIRRRGVH